MNAMDRYIICPGLLCGAVLKVPGPKELAACEVCGTRVCGATGTGTGTTGSTGATSAAAVADVEPAPGRERSMSRYEALTVAASELRLAIDVIADSPAMKNTTPGYMADQIRPLVVELTQVTKRIREQA